MVTRRELLRYMGLSAAELALVASCSPSTVEGSKNGSPATPSRMAPITPLPTETSVTIQESNEVPTPVVDRLALDQMHLWPEVPVSTDGKVNTINDWQTYQKPVIGLRGVYFIAHNRKPLLAVMTAWDEVDNRFRGYSRFNLNGSAGLQEIQQQFIPNTKSIKRVDDSISSYRETSEFMTKAALEVQTLRKQRGEKELPITGDAQMMPKNGGKFVLVIGEAYVEYKKQPSPLAYLAIRFNLDPMPQQVI